MTYYDLSLSDVTISDIFTVPIAAGGSALSIEFMWDTTAQEQYEEYKSSIEIASRSDPLIYPTEMIRDYDYVGYYISIPADVEAWLRTGPVLPSSLQGLTVEEQVTLINDRKDLCRELHDTLNLYKDMLVWNMTISYNNDVLQGKVYPGSIITSSDGSLELEIIAEKEYINRDDLPLVTLGIGVL